MGKPATNIHRLIVDLWHRPDIEARFLQDRGRVFDEYGLTAEEISALSAPDHSAMGAVGIAPISQILYGLKAFPPLQKHLSMQCHFKRYEKEVASSLKGSN